MFLWQIFLLLLNIKWFSFDKNICISVYLVISQKQQILIKNKLVIPWYVAMLLSEIHIL